MHDRIDNKDWGNDVKDIPGKGLVYFAFDLHGEILIDRVIGVGSAGAERVTPVRNADHHPTNIDSSASAPPASHEGTVEANIPESASSTAAPLSHEQRLEKAASIRAAQKHRQWIAGDTANAWEQELGESAWQYLSEFGYQPETLSNIMKVCKAIPVSLRRGDPLSFGIHTVVYPDNKEDIEAWLDEAEGKEWTVSQLREARREAGLLPAKKPKPKRWTLEELRESAYQFINWGASQNPCPPNTAGHFLNWLEEAS
jgi:hypothetical protein